MPDRLSVRESAERTAADSLTELNARRLGPVRRFFREHPRVMDAVVVVLFLTVSLPDTAFLVAESGSWAGVSGVLLAAVALACRRDHPVLVLTVVAVIDTPVSMATEGRGSVALATAVALYTVASVHPLRRTLIAFAMAATLSVSALFLAPAGFSPDVPGLIWFVSGFVVMFLVIAVGVGVTVRRDREHELVLREWATRNARLASAGERNRIAREMHDVVAHSLTVMVALSDGAAVVLKRDPDRAAAVLGELSSTGRTAIADMRRVLGVLRTEDATGPLEPLPASSSVAHLLEGFRAAGLPLRVATDGPNLPDDQAFHLTVYRILQESLTNTLRYGRGTTRVDVSITRSGSGVSLRIADDGRGVMEPGVSLGSGQGIAGMRERAAIYAGTVKCGPRPSGGWVVDVHLTVPDADHGAGSQRGEDNDDAPRSGPTHQGAAR
ncbi:sensor histidine kinase [Arthrobacter sp. RIT-PI-e]|uniref:sensor histidine kinase n=1 Tax=Arthrobacter sp. RIT-PI-e TaxID=1681197 RepID=UPI000AB62F30|nr:histidine kinase [Arthrobacter sp. RIT-PI-e]